MVQSYKQLRKGLSLFRKSPALEGNEWRQAVTPGRQQQRLTRLMRNQERYEQMLEWQKGGVKPEGIAQRLGVTVRTIQNWKKRGICPGGMRRRKRQSIFDRYAPDVLSRWQQGCRDGALLLQEIQAKGYTGQIRTVYRFIQTLKQDVGSLPPLPCWIEFRFGRPSG